MRPLLALCLSLVFGSALAAPHEGVARIVDDRLPLGAAQAALQLSTDWNQPHPEIRRALVIVHGRLRNAATYFRSGETATQAAGASADTLVIAPQFLNEQDVKRHHLPDDLLRWQGNAWMGGEPALGPRPLSSFAVFDALLAHLADRRLLPNLQEVVIAGHSGGGQVVQRYAVLGQGERALASSGIRLRFVVANPSSYAYFDAERPDAQGHVGPFAGAATCPDFNSWKYGMQGLPAYAEGRDAATLERHYAGLAITYLLGAEDTDPNHPALDKSCAAEAQGRYRLARGLNYYHYLQARHAGLPQQLVEVPGVGHNGDAMFTSPQGRQALFSAVN
ncbi:alpha/beta hydrolase [Pseudomonas oryzihabitans]|uniref:alpha/beta hydrolase n=1 Tax=Pseudomonas oryzihabitans TaxID=47885 RepID=UPI00285D1191|nr:alpha/beta hydrolase [Pseudomonas psychrotolerans]MDR6677351.1 pimeloyl-ACP methyl ester carboxylesterase [Pseudomonas psychrotolerans]